MIRLLVETPTGAQELIHVHESGGYFDASRVLWDERIDGVFPAPLKQVGGLVRNGTKLKYSVFKKLSRILKKMVRKV